MTVVDSIISISVNGNIDKAVYCKIERSINTTIIISITLLCPNICTSHPTNIPVVGTSVSSGGHKVAAVHKG